MEKERSMSLLQLMENEGVLPSPEMETKRRNVIDKLNQTVMQWAKKVAYLHEFPRSCIKSTSATILLFGSCGLGVQDNESDVDALCVGPSFATIGEDFFVVLRDMLASIPEVSEILCIKDAGIPLMQFKFDGISIYLLYATVDTIFVPENVLDPFFITNIDDVSWRSWSGVLVNKSILRLVPKLEVYKSLLRSVKFWARRRGIYTSALGFFGGVHLTVLAAYVCQKHPYADLSDLVSIFFDTFALWSWPKPVILEDGVMPLPPNRSRNRSYGIPIQLPCSLRQFSPNEYCYCGITISTYNKIIGEFRRGRALTKDFLQPEFDWKVLFEPFPYAKSYKSFLKICLSSTYPNELAEWVGWVKPRFGSLLPLLEKWLESCDPNPAEYIDHHLQEPNAVFFWGLRPGLNGDIIINRAKESFTKIISKGYHGPVGRMELTVVEASEFLKTSRSK